MKENLKATIIESIDKVVHSLRIGNNVTGNEELILLIDKLIKYTSIIKDQLGGDELVLKINETLPAIMSTIQNKDYVFLCDILKYGLKSRIEMSGLVD